MLRKFTNLKYKTMFLLYSKQNHAIKGIAITDCNKLYTLVCDAQRMLKIKVSGFIDADDVLNVLEGLVKLRDKTEANNIMHSINDRITILPNQ